MINRNPVSSSLLRALKEIPQALFILFRQTGVDRSLFLRNLQFMSLKTQILFGALHLFLPLTGLFQGLLLPYVLLLQTGKIGAEGLLEGRDMPDIFNQGRLENRFDILLGRHSEYGKSSGGIKDFRGTDLNACAS